jgi:mRNA interferase MazF
MYHEECDLMFVNQGDVVLLDFSSQPKISLSREPIYVVLSNQYMNELSPVMIVVPLIGDMNKRLPSHVELDGTPFGLPSNSIVLTENVRTVAKSLILEVRGNIGTELLDEVSYAYAFNTFQDTEFSKRIHTYPKKFIKGQEIPLKEDYEHEFKEIIDFGNMNKFKDEAIKYICAYLNGEGGRLLYGIEDKTNKVVGVKLTSEKRDELVQLLNNTIRDRIMPRVLAPSYRIELHHVFTKEGYEKEQPLEDEYILEILILPPYDITTVYYDGGLKIWTKLNAGKDKFLRGQEITEFILYKASLKGQNRVIKLRK